MSRTALPEACQLDSADPVAPPIRPGPAIVTARMLRSSNRSARAWDAFAAACDHVSFVGCLFYASLSAATGKLVTVEIFVREDGREQKVGQAAVICTLHGERHIVDGLKLLPGCAKMWPEAMLSLLQLIGPGRWRYGSHWSGEPPRADALAALPGVTVCAIRLLSIYVIDFARWPDWDGYLHALNSNVRRSLRKSAALPDLRVEVETGWRAGRKICLLDTMRRATLRRKGITNHPSLRCWPSSAIRFLLRVVALGKGVVVAVAHTGGEAQAMFSGVEFGSSTFYLEGASRGANDGVSWHLLVAMIERNYRRNPSGRFVMGHEDDVNRTGVGWNNLVRSRLQCQAEPVPSDAAIFDYLRA